MNAGSGQFVLPFLSFHCWRVATGPGTGLEVRQGVGEEGGHRVLHEGVPQGAGQLQNGGSDCRFVTLLYSALKGKMKLFFMLIMCKPHLFLSLPTSLHPLMYHPSTKPFYMFLRLDSACCLVTTGVDGGAQQLTVRGWREEDEHEDQRGGRTGVSVQWMSVCLGVVMRYHLFFINVELSVSFFWLCHCFSATHSLYVVGPRTRTASLLY